MFNKMFKLKNIGTGWIYFYIHFITEIVCFYYLTKITNNSMIVWLIPLIYVGLAFVPQSIIGYISDKYPKLNVGLIGCILLLLGLIIYVFSSNVLISLISICLGNCFIHVSGAEVTLRTSNGKLSHSAIFVAGGSFGVISGKLLSKHSFSIWLILFLCLTMIPFIIYASTYKKEDYCINFNYTKNKSPYLIVLFAILVVIVRGYMGYGIPTSWKQTTIETVIFYTSMGIGKALGGILSDYFGIKCIALVSTLLSIPFLCFGDNIMLISLIGVTLFSMTMSITLGILVSVLKKTPGLAFGLTTIGLFLGTIPIFFIKITNSIFNIFLIIVLSVLCSIILNRILEDKNYGRIGYLKNIM